MHCVKLHICGTYKSDTVIFIVFSVIIAFQQTQTVLLTAFKLILSLFTKLYKLHLLNAFRLFFDFFENQRVEQRLNV